MAHSIMEIGSMINMMMMENVTKPPNSCPQLANI